MRATSRAGPRKDDRDEGMVTVEAAIALCGLITVVALVLTGLSAVLAQMQCTDAAREAARLVALGERQQADDAGRRIAPSGASVAITTDSTSVTVVVADDPLGFLHVQALAYEVREPETLDPAGRSNRMQVARPAEGEPR